MKENIVVIKSYAFALEIIKTYKYLVEEKKEYVLSKQLLRCGTSIGANLEESVVSISYKEAGETKYWLRLLKDSDYLHGQMADVLLQDCEELLKIMGAIISTTSKMMKK